SDDDMNGSPDELRTAWSVLFFQRRTLIRNCEADWCGARHCILRFMQVLRLGCAVLLAATMGIAARGITAEDYFAFESIADPHISPDGHQIVYTVTTIDRQ